MTYPPEIYTADTGEATAWLRPADSLPEVVYKNGNKVRFLARGGETGGTYGLYHWDFAGPVSGPAPHFHRTITESFYVLDGHVTIYDGKGWVKCGAGDYVHVPAGGLHGFRNEDGPARMLLHFAPGAPREPYFEGLAGGVADWSEERYDEFMREHDNVWVDEG